MKLGASRTAGTVAGPAGARGGYRHSSGQGWTAGVGYDARLGRHFSLTPYATWAVAVNADLPHPVNTSAARYGGQVLLAGVALTVH